MAIGSVKEVSGRFAIVGLPAGAYRLVLSDSAGSEPPLELVVDYDGKDREVRWVSSKEPPAKE